MRVPRGARAAAIGAAGGLFAGLTGVGGGAILVPLLVSALRMRQHAAHGTSLAVIGAGALAGAATYARTTSIDWPLAMTLLPTALLGAAAGATFVQRIPAIRLRALFGAFLFAVALRMALPLGGAAAHVDGVWRLLLGAGTGLAGGLLSGALGVGGGAVFVPALVLLFGESQHAAQGVSLAVIVPTAAAGTATHWRHGSVDGSVAAWLALGAVPGSAAGAAVASSLRADVLQRGFAAVLLAVGAQMVWSGWRAARTPAAQVEGTPTHDAG
ncbi:hypothetical protein HRbin29_00899 [bacterium HR29]|jgi:uncharacterized membrane protein YfcA|nr:hypothetical protein HRbin29_00899 [bacterium HR29]